MPLSHLSQYKVKTLMAMCQRASVEGDTSQYPTRHLVPRLCRIEKKIDD